MKWRLLVVVFFCLACAHVYPESENNPAFAAAVRHMDVQLRKDGLDHDVLFLAMPGRKDPAPTLLRDLADLNVKPLSAAYFVQENPDHPVLEPRDKGSKKKGKVVEIVE